MDAVACFSVHDERVVIIRSSVLGPTEQLQEADFWRRACCDDGEHPARSGVAAVLPPEAPLLREAYLDLKRNAAPGVDGVDWPAYGAELSRQTQGSHLEVR